MKRAVTFQILRLLLGVEGHAKNGVCACARHGSPRKYVDIERNSPAIMFIYN